MSAKEYLGQIQAIVMSLKSLSRQVQSLEEALTGGSPTVNDMPSSATPNVNSMPKLIAAQIDLERKIDIQSKRLAEITNTVNSLPNPIYTAILTARYVAGMEWREIANEMRLSPSHMYQLHSDALKEIEKMSKPD
jgi:DNA-directed RNA polymerase specialized sigma subunit